MSVTTQSLYSTFMLALCAWREARGESFNTQRGVIWSILNRAAKPGWWGRDTVSVVLCPYQYSSFNQNDPNATKFPSPDDSIWKEIVLAAVSPGSDPTDGATHYYDDSIAPPSWIAEMTFTTKLGRLNFYK